ncbi:MAG: hypothetical protein EOP11_12145 [Proteobacteria bacterium]|nr:MAG: hypothetical protein EOP11_12145 [Pseudomonadota bacterium]
MMRGFLIIFFVSAFGALVTPSGNCALLEKAERGPAVSAFLDGRDLENRNKLDRDDELMNRRLNENSTKNPKIKSALDETPPSSNQMPPSSSRDSDGNAGANATGAQLGQTVAQEDVAKDVRTAAGGANKKLGDVKETSGLVDHEMKDISTAAAEQAKRNASDELKRRAASSQPTAESRSRANGYANDVEITRVVAEKVEAGKPVLKNDVLGLYDPEIRKQLLAIPLGYEAQKELKQEEFKLSTALAQLTQMANIAAARSKGMGTQEGAGKKIAEDKATAAAIEEANLAKATAAPADTNLSDLAIDKLLDEKLAAALAKAEASNKAAGKFPLTPEEKLSLRNKLRAGLRQQLIAQAKAAAEAKSGALDSFTGGLNREQVASATDSEEQATHGLGDVIGSTFSAVKEAGFSMAHSETEAAVNGILTESSRELASTTEILAADSTPLFIRVSSAHRRCEARHCLQ